MTPEHAQKPQDDASTSQDSETDGNSTDTNTNGVLSVNIEGLGRPEHEDGEEIGTGDEGDNKCQGKGARSLLEPAGEHGEFGKLGFPDDKHDEERETEDQRGQNMSG